MEAARNPRNHRYSLSRGHSAICARRSSSAIKGITASTLDPDKEAIVTIGAKDALAHLLFAIIGPGDAVVSPNPCYPIHQYGVHHGGRPRLHAAHAGPGDVSSNALEDLYRKSAKTPRMMLISFPHNPTTQCVDLDFFKEIVRLARAARHHGRARFRLRRSGLRRLQAAQHSASGGREGSGGRDFLDVEELQHGGLARGLLPGQRRA